MSTAPAFSPSAQRRSRIILAVCGLYVAVQVGIIVMCHFTSSKHFGFWMFPESTYLRAHLYRVLPDGTEVKTKKGSWKGQTEAGEVRYRWNDYVKGYRMDLLGKKVRSKGTFDDTAKYFQGAVNYVAARTAQDKSTHQLVLRIQYHRAGGPEQMLIYKSPPRVPEGSQHAAK